MSYTLTPVTFDDVKAGDMLTFTTGNSKPVSGTVINKTAKTVVVSIDDRRNAHLRAEAWDGRNVHREDDEEATFDLDDTAPKAEIEAVRLRAEREEVKLDVHMLTPDGNMCGGTGPDTAGTGHVTCEDCWTLLTEEADREARGVSLCPVWDVPEDECDCSECEALHADDQTEADDDQAVEAEEDEGVPALHELFSDHDPYPAWAKPSVPAPAEGRVIAHQGSGRGVAPEHADNPAARAAIFTLTNAGFTPVTVTGEFDPTPGDGTTGFYVEIRRTGMSEEIVYVHDVLDGKLTWRRDADSKLSDYAKALANAGWSIPTGTAQVVRALPPVEPAEPSIVFEPGPNRIGGAHERRWSIGGRPSRDRAEARNILTDRYGWDVQDAEQALEDSARTAAVDQEDAPAPLPKRTPGATRVQDAITRHRTNPADQAPAKGRVIASAPSVAKYAQWQGERVIMASDGRGWARSGKKWVFEAHGARYELEKRKRNPLDGTHTTGWYLYGGVVGYAGEFCAPRLLEAAEEASAEIGRLEDSQDDDGAEEPVHSHYVACGETGGVQTTWDSRLVTCGGCLRNIHPERHEEAPSEGRVIAHQGAGRGVTSKNADNPDARAAVAVLEAAGLPLADLPEEYDPETSNATGFMVVPRDGEMVYVYYLEDGQTTDADGDVPRNTLRRAARALRDAGWAVDPQIFKCVRAHQVHDAPAPQRDHSVAEEIARLVEARNLEAAPITPQKGDAIALMVRGCARAGRVASVRGDIIHLAMLDIDERVAALVNELPEMRAEVFRPTEYGHRDGHVRAAINRAAELASAS